MEFDVKGFLDSPTREQFDNLRKCDLLEVAGFLTVDVQAGMKKAGIKKIVLGFLVAQNIIPEGFEDVKVDVSSSSFEIRKLELEFQERMQERKDAQLFDLQLKKDAQSIV